MSVKSERLKFSLFVRKYKATEGYQSFIETISHIVDNNIYPGIFYDNVKDYLNESLKRSVEAEYSKKRLIGNELPEVVENVPSILDGIDVEQLFDTEVKEEYNDNTLSEE